MKAIKLTPETSDRAMRNETIKGAEYRVAVSPYFFPERLECEYDRKSESYRLTFRYIDNEREATGAKPTDASIEVKFGKHTKRLLSVIVHTKRLDQDRLRLLFTEIIPQILKQARSDNPALLESYRSIGAAIDAHREEIADCAPRK
jgi:hypothetical protein